jgi:hypothetical protein
VADTQADDPLCGQATDVSVAENDLALSRGMHPAYGVQKGGLARPVAPDNGHDFPFAYLQMDIIQSLNLAIKSAHISGF